MNWKKGNEFFAVPVGLTVRAAEERIRNTVIVGSTLTRRFGESFPLQVKLRQGCDIRNRRRNSRANGGEMLGACESGYLQNAVGFGENDSY